MLIPIRHENMSARRWPVVTIGLIALNAIIFLLTHFTMQEQAPPLNQAYAHILILAASHPELDLRPDAKRMASNFAEHHHEAWDFLKNKNRRAIDAWETGIRNESADESALQDEMDSLTKQYADLRRSSILYQYGFVPTEHSPLSYITSNFLHGGWLHLIGNMWFLWLAGFVLEDAWGRIAYAIFYVFAGAVAVQFFAWTNPGSTTATIGASGAVAALMGAFLVRFPKMKIQMVTWFFFIRYRFKASAYWLLPIWLGLEIFYGSVVGTADGVAHWAHVGGFIFGALVACALRFSHLEHKVSQSIEEKTSWTSDPAIDQATELMQQGRLDEAITLLNSFTTTHPDSVDAVNLLQQLCWRKGDMPAFREGSLKLCALHVKARDWELAWQCFQELRNASDQQIPANLWFELCRAAEHLKNYELALKEYQQLISAYPSDRCALMSQIAAGRICMTQFNRPQDALKFFQAASASPVPHLDWEQTIAAGIRSANAALASPHAASASLG